MTDREPGKGDGKREVRSRRQKARIRRLIAFAAIAGAVMSVAWLLFVGLSRWHASPPSIAAAPRAGSTTIGAHRRIRATLFYLAEDGLNLQGAETEVPFAEDTVTQAQHILDAQLQPSTDRLSAIPRAVRLRGVFLTSRGEAFVDLSSEVSRSHGGGSFDELLTVYAIVNALTVNLPAIASVQILIDGKEVETLAGHVDLRKPLRKDLGWIRTDRTTETTNYEGRSTNDE